MDSQSLLSQCPQCPQDQAPVENSASDKRRKYYIANAERIRQRQRQYYAKNRDKWVQYVKTYRAANKEKVREAHRKYRAENLERRRTNERIRRGLPNPTRPCPELCEAGCGRKAVVLDHCHGTGAFRGWLCHACNLGIGKMGDTLAAFEHRVDQWRRYLLAAEVISN